MKYFVLVATFAIGVSTGILITPEPPTEYNNFVTEASCKNEITRAVNTTRAAFRELVEECAQQLEACLAEPKDQCIYTLDIF